MLHYIPDAFVFPVIFCFLVQIYKARIKAYFGELFARVVFQHGTPGLAQMERSAIGDVMDTSAEPMGAGAGPLSLGQLLPVRVGVALNVYIREKRVSSSTEICGILPVLHMFYALVLLVSLLLCECDDAVAFRNSVRCRCAVFFFSCFPMLVVLFYFIFVSYAWCS